MEKIFIGILLVVAAALALKLIQVLFFNGDF